MMTPRSSVLRLVARVIGVLVAILLVAVVIAGAWTITRDTGGPVETGFLREVHVLVDISSSMTDSKNRNAAVTLEQAKQLAEKVVGSCGSGDWLAVYSISTGFLEGRNVLANEGVAMVPIGFRRMEERRRVLRDPEAVATLRRSGESAIAQGAWLAAIASLELDPADGESDYLSAFDYVAKRLTVAKRPRRQIELVAFGDLEQFPHSEEPPTPGPDQVDAFAGVRVQLAYPYRVGKSTDRSNRRVDVESYWRQYFKARGADDITIAPFGSGVTIPAPLAF